MSKVLNYIEIILTILAKIFKYKEKVKKEVSEEVRKENTVNSTKEYLESKEKIQKMEADIQKTKAPDIKKEDQNITF